MPKVRMIESRVSGYGQSWDPGEEYDVDAVTAERWTSGEYPIAELVDDTPAAPGKRRPGRPRKAEQRVIVADEVRTEAASGGGASTARRPATSS
jgi:hypothetical protein